MNNLIPLGENMSHKALPSMAAGLLQVMLPVICDVKPDKLPSNFSYVGQASNPSVGLTLPPFPVLENKVVGNT